MANSDDDQLTPKEIDARREAGLKKLLAMPHTPHKPPKKTAKSKKKAKPAK